MGHSFLSDPTNTYYFGYSSYKQPSRECPSSTYYLMSDSQVLLLLRLQLHFSVQDNRRFRWFWLDSRCQIERSKRRKFFIFHSSSIGSDHKHTHKSDRSVRQHSVQSEDESISDFGSPLVKCFCTNYRVRTVHKLKVQFLDRWYDGEFFYAPGDNSLRSLLGRKKVWYDLTATT